MEALSAVRPRPADSVELLAGWRAHLLARGHSPETVRSYSGAVLRVLLEAGQPATAVTEEDIDAFLASLGRRAATRAMTQHALRSFYGWLLRRGYISSDPTAGVRVRKPHHAPPVVLEEDELTRLMIAAAWRDPRRAWTILLTFSLGARRREVAGLAPGDVLGDRVVLRRTKGDRPRVVPLSESARIALEELRPWWTETSVLGGIVPQTITEWCKEAAEDAGLADKVRRRPCHVLRASFATHLLRSGTPIHVVRDLMGHRDVSTTSIYAVATDPEYAAAVARLPFASRR